MPRALMSVYDKTGLVEFATELVQMGWELVASGGTEKTLVDAGLSVTPVSQLTGMPEMLGGRVKTLHPAIHAGILARDRGDDLDEIGQHGYAPINMVVCNLYPFEETISNPNATLQDAIEQIDIGGVTLLRAAAKNFFRITTVCDPNDYSKIIAMLKAAGNIDIALKRDLAVKAFAQTRNYDTAIYAYLATDQNIAENDDGTLGEHLSFAVHSSEPLRYGENPHQSARYYSRTKQDTPLNAVQYGGKQLSYNNILDVDAAWRVVSSYSEPTVVIVKHLTPTGIASNESIHQAFTDALASDPVSAFGGIIAVNREVDIDFVKAMGTLFVEVVCAPSFTDEARETLNKKRKNCRLLEMANTYDFNAIDVRSVMGGLLVQRLDQGDPDGTQYKTVTQRIPTSDEMSALQFAWKAVQHVKSNAIVLARVGRTIGVGGGLPSRVDAAYLAITKAGDEAKGSVMASDAFFPFADGLQVAIDAGVTAVIQPGGSIRDAEVINAADEAGIAMVFTGLRHFRH